MLPFIVNGLVTGAVYGLAAVGLVLTYKTSAVFNFAHGALATISAYLFYTLHVEKELAWPLAAAISVLGVTALMAPVFERFAAAISGASLALRVTATVGVLLVVQAAVVLIYGVDETRIVPVFLAEGEFELGGTVVRNADLITFLFAIAATTALYLLFRFSRQGIAMRAVVENPELVELAGTNATRVRRSAWFIGVLFACASGVLFASLLPLEPTTLTLLVVQAFGAAAIGGFTSLPLTFVGGLGIGVLASLSTKWFTDGLLAGLPPSLPFVVLFVVLLVFPRRYLVDRAAMQVSRARETWSAPAPLQVGSAAVLLVALASVPAFAGVRIIDWTVAVATSIVFLSLGLLVRTSGQVSLSHVGFMAIGTAGLGHLTVDTGLPWGLALLVAGLIAVPVGALLAIPAIRLTGLYLALATFGFGVVLAYMFYTQDFMFGDTGAGLEVPRPAGFESDGAYFRLVLGFATAATILVVTLNRSRLGRLLRGMSESPVALATSGVNVNMTRVIVFCVSAFLAAIGGALAAGAQQSVGLTSYPPLLSLTFLALAIIVVGREPWYAIIAAVALILIPSYVEGEDIGNWMQLLFGAGAIAYAVLPAQLWQTPMPVRRAVERAFDRGPFARGPVTARATDGSAADDLRASPGSLASDDLTVRFGGLVAVDGASLEAPTGRITGLIGPNGAGKTTTFNACSGLVRPASGRVLIDGGDVTRRSAAARARSGLGRTFQRMELFDSLSVFDNVTIATEGHHAGANPARHLLSSPREDARAAANAMRALELCEIADLAGVPAGNLSTGQRRLVELARCLAGPSRILLLDEPSSGLDGAETQRFGAVLRRVVDERAVGILLVEHDMSLVMGVCDHIYVLDFGRMIFAGSPSEVRASAVVKSAYLGADDGLVEAAAR